MISTLSLTVRQVWLDGGGAPPTELTSALLLLHLSKKEKESAGRLGDYSDI